MVRLFMSIDMVGSTLFKGRGGSDWLSIFQAFFTNFPLMLAGEVAREFLDVEATPAVEVWKVLGDEVIFVCEPASNAEVTGLMRAMFATMRTYENRQFAELPLRLKGTAWVADFQTANMELEIPELTSDDDHGNVDYIGPDIDLGFRLGKFARSASVTVSLDLLELLLASPNRDEVEIFHVGHQELKGVVFGRPYPIIWLRAAGEPFAFMPWETEQCALMTAAVHAAPADDALLSSLVADMRLYLLKMHGIRREPITLG